MCPAAECGSRKVIKARWSDTDEGDHRSPDVRFRLVAKEVKQSNNTVEESASFFAPTPLLEPVTFPDFGSHDRESISKQSSVGTQFRGREKAHVCSEKLRILPVEATT